MELGGKRDEYRNVRLSIKYGERQERWLNGHENEWKYASARGKEWGTSTRCNRDLRYGRYPRFNVVNLDVTHYIVNWNSKKLPSVARQEPQWRYRTQTYTQNIQPQFVLSITNAVIGHGAVTKGMDNLLLA